jgi:hypothetical protein
VTDQEEQSRQRWCFGCSGLLGAFGGVLVAPHLQRWGRFWGVDQYSITPAVVIVVLGGILGGVLGARRRGGS